MNFKKKLNEYRRKIYIRKIRKRNKVKDVTIISQNCIGGLIYSDLGLKFLSPTINLFIEGDNFVKLVENLEYYMSLTPTKVTDCFIDPINSKVRYPIIKIDDIKICCLHYKNCKDAIEAWERRKQRINYDNVVVIANSWNLKENKKFINRLGKIKYKKIIFTYKNYKKDYCIKLPGDVWKVDERGIVRPNLTDTIPNSPYKYLEKIFDFVKFINE